MLLKSILLINISYTLSHKYLLIEIRDEKKTASVQANAVRANRRGLMGYNDDDFSSESMSHSDENMSDGARDALSRMLKSPNFFPQSRSKSDQYLSYEDVNDQSTFSRVWKALIEEERKDREKDCSDTKSMRRRLRRRRCKIPLETNFKIRI